MALSSTKLKLVPTGTPRPFLEIVQALQLDSDQLPAADKAKPAKRNRGATPAQAANDGSIPESGRNNTLMSMAGAMRNKGMSESAISAALQAENLANCKPPLDPAEVSAIAASVMRYAAADPAKLLKSLTDTGNAARFSSRYADTVRYVFGMGWVVWDEYRWKRDQVAHIMELAKALARTIHLEAAAIDNDDVSEAVAKHAKASLQAPKLKAMGQPSAMKQDHSAAAENATNKVDSSNGNGSSEKAPCHNRTQRPEISSWPTMQTGTGCSPFWATNSKSRTQTAR